MEHTPQPIFKSIREIARTGLLPECFLRKLQKQGKLPGLYSGRKFLINYDKLVEFLNDPESIIYR